jgi:hypothetical protein
VAESEESKIFLKQVKIYVNKNPKQTFIIINAFCDMKTPRHLYKLRVSNVVMINLFVIANDKRFKEIMSNNIQSFTDNFDWFSKNVEIANRGCEIIAKDLEIFTRS